MSSSTKEGIEQAIKNENEDYKDYLEKHKEWIKGEKESLKEAIALVNKPNNYIEKGMYIPFHTKEQKKAMIASHRKHSAGFIEYYENGLKQRKAHHQKTMKELREKMKVISTRKKCPKGTRKNKAGDCVKK